MTRTVIDAHLHFWDARWLPEGLRQAWARQGVGRRLPERTADEVLEQIATGHNDPNADLTIAAFDRAGVAAGVVPVVDWTIVGRPTGQHLPISELHAQYEKVATEHDGRLFFCAGIDPRHSNAPELLATGTANPHCRGVKLYPAAGWDLCDPAHDWLYTELLDLGIPAVIHTSPLGGDPLQTIRCRPAQVAALLALHPTLPVTFAHAGLEAWWREALDCATGWQSAYLELSLWQRVANADYAEFRRRIAMMRAQVGAHRMLFGSDTVRGVRKDPDGAELAQWVDKCRGLGEQYKGEKPVLSAEEVHLFMGGNAARLFQIDVST